MSQIILRFLHSTLVLSTHTHIYTYIHTYIDIYVYIYVYIYRERGRERERERRSLDTFYKHQIYNESLISRIFYFVLLLSDKTAIKPHPIQAIGQCANHLQTKHGVFTIFIWIDSWWLYCHNIPNNAESYWSVLSNLQMWGGWKAAANFNGCSVVVNG